MATNVGRLRLVTVAVVATGLAGFARSDPAELRICV
jgi:hypothetical protein